MIWAFPPFEHRCTNTHRFQEMKAQGHTHSRDYASRSKHVCRLYSQTSWLTRQMKGCGDKLPSVSLLVSYILKRLWTHSDARQKQRGADEDVLYMAEKWMNQHHKYAAGDSDLIFATRSVIAFLYFQYNLSRRALVVILCLRYMWATANSLNVKASECVHLTKSDRVCVLEFCRRCWGVLKEDEGEEWGLSKAWGRRRSRRREGGREDEGDGMSGIVSYTNTHSLVKTQDGAAYLHVAFTWVHRQSTCRSTEEMDTNYKTI